MSIFLPNNEKNLPQCFHQSPAFFCTYKSCFKSLCSLCIPTHTHPTNKQFLIPIIEAQKVCQEKTDKYLESLKYELEKLNVHLNELELQKNCNEDFKYILKTKQNVKKLVKKFFDSLEEEYDKQFYENFDKKMEELNEIQDKISFLFTQLSQIQLGLREKKLIAVEECYNIDIKTEIQRLSSEFKEVIERNPYRKFEGLFETTTNIEFIIKNVFHESLKLLTEDSLGPAKPNSKGKKVVINDQLIDTSATTSIFLITQNNFFEKNSLHKCLPFFNLEENTLHLINLDEITNENLESNKNFKPKFDKIKFSSQIELPQRHRTVILPDGTIYLIGGHYKISNLTSSETLRFNWETKAFVNRADMYTPRKSFGVCYNDGFIYVVGGFNYDEGFLDKCERYEIYKDKWTSIEGLKGGPASSCSVCVFKNTFLFKFGGLKAPKTINESIERYDIKGGKWLSFNIDKKQNNVDLEFLWLSAAVQINENEIMVFGGIDIENKSSDQSFIVKVINEIMFRVISVGVRKLKQPGGFWNCQALVHNQMVVSLENVVMEKNGDKAHENRRSFICFGDFNWKQ